MQINHLVVVSGPYGSGKSTMLKNLRENNLPLISKPLGRGNTSTRKFVEMVAPTHVEYDNTLQNLSKPHIDGLIITYNFFHNLLMKKVQNFEEDERLDVLLKSDKITFLTLWVKPEILSKRYTLREKRYWTKNFNLQGVIKFSKSKFKSNILFKRSNKIKKIKGVYNSPFLYYAYDKWFDFISSFNGSANWIVDNSEDNIQNIKLLPQSKWQEIIEYKT